MTEQRATILIVDNEPEGKSILDLLLQSAGYLTLTADGEDAALAVIALQRPDLILLDIVAPDLDGYQLLNQLRNNPSCLRIPIIMVSARKDDPDEALSLELGADDYIRKPFEPRLLLARIKACLRRTMPPPRDHISFGKFTIDRRERSAHLGKQEMALTAAEFDLLWLLASHAGQVLSRAAIFWATRGLEYDGHDRSIDMRISRLRKLLHDDPHTPRLIKAIRGQGYLFSRRGWPE
ncbi:MAG TPA: response regulator transcription factor [Gallionellaceae bacterium]